MNFGAPEMLIVLLVAVVIFGPSKLPKLARSIGEAAHELRRGAMPDADPAPRGPAALDAEPPAAGNDQPHRSIYRREG